MENDEDEDREDALPTPYSKAERVFVETGSLRGLSVRFGKLGGAPRLSVGEDCEDGMAEFRRLESARRLREEG